MPSFSKSYVPWYCTSSSFNNAYVGIVLPMVIPVASILPLSLQYDGTLLTGRNYLVKDTLFNRDLTGPFTLAYHVRGGFGSLGNSGR